MAASSSRASRPDTYLGESSTSSHRNPSKSPEIAESSDYKKKGVIDNPSYRFSFSVPARILKRAICGLADPELNPDGLGMMEVCRDGFEVTVYECSVEDEKVFGLLSLKASGLINFMCRRAMVRMINLVDIAAFLELNACDGDILVLVYNVDGSDRLCFTFERRVLGGTNRFSTEVPFTNAPPITKFPAFSYGFEVDIPINKLEPVLDSVLELIPRRRPLSVSMTIDTIVTMKIGKKNEVKVDERKIVFFLFPYWESLKKTIALADPCTIWLVTHPVHSVVLRFDLKEYGEFIYLKKASEFFMRKDLPNIGTFKQLFRR